MVFSTPLFLFCFLTGTLLIYYTVPHRARNIVLLCSSLLFYYWGEQSYTVIMLLSTVIDYTHGLLVERSKAKGNDRGARRAVASSIAFNLALLLFFKYWDFLAQSLADIGLPVFPVLGIHLPIGISFYTFQTMSYTIDVYRGDAKVQKNLLNFGTFVTLFPQLIAGPIIKYKDLGDQIDTRACSVERFSAGTQTFLLGLSKKLLLANNVALLWDSYHAMATDALSVLGAWLGVLAYTFQIYFDFSGYSDMAVGLGRMLGFEFLPNFNFPYVSKSITEFWRRWHISLSSWFREYLYIPLGGNRCSKVKWVRNLFLVWAATGIWHGASWNFLLWGLYFFALLLLEKFFLLRHLERAPALLSHLYTMLLVVIAWTIFAIEDFSQLGSYLAVMFGFGGVPLYDAAFGYYLKSYAGVLLLCALCSTPLFKHGYNALSQRTQQAAGIALEVGAMVLCTAYVVASTYNPFLYFRF